jgi:hypothetical protein
VNWGLIHWGRPAVSAPGRRATARAMPEAGGGYCAGAGGRTKSGPGPPGPAAPRQGLEPLSVARRSPQRSAATRLPIAAIFAIAGWNLSPTAFSSLLAAPWPLPYMCLRLLARARLNALTRNRPVAECGAFPCFRRAEEGMHSGCDAGDPTSNVDLSGRSATRSRANDQIISRSQAENLTHPCAARARIKCSERVTDLARAD